MICIGKRSFLIRSLRSQHLFLDSRQSSIKTNAVLDHMNLATKIGRNQIFEKIRKIDYTCIRSTIWYWKSKIHILKMFLRPHHNWKKIWSKFDFLIFSKFWGHQSNLGVTKNSIFGGHQSPPGSPKTRFWGVTNQPLRVTKKSVGSLMGVTKKNMVVRGDFEIFQSTPVCGPCAVACGDF